MQKSLVSLGVSCQSAHQLARFATAHGDQVTFEKGPFDWLICPPQSAIGWLDADLDDFEPSEITDYRGHAYWSRFDFWFWHGFFTNDDGASWLDIGRNMEREHSKLAYQRDVFRNLDPARTIFVLSNSQNNLAGDVFRASEEHLYHFDAAVCDRVEQALERYFKAPVNLHIVSRRDRIAASAADRENMHFLRGEASEWKGNDADWDALLQTIIKSK